MDVQLDNSDGLCGPAGYMLYSENPNNTADCAASSICHAVLPGAGRMPVRQPRLVFHGAVAIPARADLRAPPRSSRAPFRDGPL